MEGVVMGLRMAPWSERQGLKVRLKENMQYRS
jgi:hypothetical protein